eukprot:gene7871-20828_t
MASSSTDEHVADNWSNAIVADYHMASATPTAGELARMHGATSSILPRAESIPAPQQSFSDQMETHFMVLNPLSVVAPMLSDQSNQNPGRSVGGMRLRSESDDVGGGSASAVYTTDSADLMDSPKHSAEDDSKVVHDPMPWSTIQGFYEATAKVQNGKAVFQNILHGEFICFYDTHKRWCIKRTFDDNDVVRTQEFGLLHPTESSSWEISDGMWGTVSWTSDVGVSGMLRIFKGATAEWTNISWGLTGGSLSVTVADPLLASVPLRNSTNGGLMVIERGECTFGTKALHAQQAGADAVLIINNDEGLVQNGFGKNEASAKVTIPVYGCEKEPGIQFIAAAKQTVLQVYIKEGVLTPDVSFGLGRVQVRQATEGEAMHEKAAVAKADALPGFKITNATGRDTSNLINGVYRATDDKQNGRPVFARVGLEDWCCWYTTTYRWHIGTCASKDANNLDGKAYQTQTGQLSPATPDGTWTIYNGSEWEEQAAVAVESLATKEDVEREVTAINAVVAKADALAGFKITNATGRDTSNLINGVYRATDDKQNGRPVFARVGLEDWCCWYTTTYRWIIGTCASKDANNLDGYAYQTQTGQLSPATPDGTWTIYNGSEWEEQADVAVESLATKEDVEREVTAINAVVAKADALAGFKITNATGRDTSNLINGVYRATDDKQNGRPVFARVGLEDWCCWYTTTYRWHIGTCASKDANNLDGNAYQTQTGQLSPATPDGTWTIYNGSEWEEQAAVAVDPLTKENIDTFCVAVAEADALPGFKVTNVTGVANTERYYINGVYVRTDKRKNGRPVFARTNLTGYYCCFDYKMDKGSLTLTKTCCWQFGAENLPCSKGWKCHAHHEGGASVLSPVAKGAAWIVGGEGSGEKMLVEPLAKDMLVGEVQTAKAALIKTGWWAKLYAVWAYATYAMAVLDIVDAGFDYAFVAELASDPATVQHAAWLGVCTTITLCLEMRYKPQLHRVKRADSALGGEEDGAITNYSIHEKSGRKGFLAASAILELIIFLIEDATTLLVWWQTGTYLNGESQASTTSQANLYLTIASSMLALIGFIYGFVSLLVGLGLNCNGYRRNAIASSIFIFGICIPLFLICACLIFWAYIGINVVLQGGSYACLGICGENSDNVTTVMYAYTFDFSLKNYESDASGDAPLSIDGSGEFEIQTLGSEPLNKAVLAIASSSNESSQDLTAAHARLRLSLEQLNIRAENEPEPRVYGMHGWGNTFQDVFQAKTLDKSLRNRPRKPQRFQIFQHRSIHL